jgi:hypothetical protein
MAGNKDTLPLSEVVPDEIGYRLGLTSPRGTLDDDTGLCFDAPGDIGLLLVCRKRKQRFDFRRRG